MGLFIILRHLVAPLAGYANLQDQLARKQQLDPIRRAHSTAMSLQRIAFSQ